MTHPTSPDRERDEIADLLHLAGPREGPPDVATARVRQAVHEEWRRHTMHHRRRSLLTWAGLSAAAAAIVLSLAYRTLTTVDRREPAATPVVIGAVVERIIGRVTVDGSGAEPVAAGRPLPAGSTIETSSASFASLRLSSGSEMRLDATTRVRLDDRQALVLERGAIYIDSDVTTGGGVSVATPLGVVRDIGTRFEVRIAGATLRIRVRDGLVRLERQGVTNDASPGMELTASADALDRRSISLHGSDWDWTQRVSAPFELEGRTLAGFLDWVERESGWHVKIPDRALARTAPQIILHGSITGVGPVDALGVVLPTCGLRHRVAGGDILIERQ